MKAIFLLLFIIGCGQDLTPINEADLFDTWWEIVEAGAPLKEYENEMCFIIYSDQTLYFNDGILNGPYYWDRIDESTYKIEDFAEIVVQDIPETNKIDWDILIRKFPMTANIVAEKCSL